MLFIHFLPLLFPCDLNYTISLPSNLLLYGTDGELRHSMLLYFMIKALIRTINSSRHADSSEGVFGTKKHLKMVEFPLSLRHALVFKVYCSTDVTGENGRGWWWGGTLRWMWRGVMARGRREQRVTEVIGPSVVVKLQFNQMCLKSASFCLHSFPVKNTSDN